MQTNILIIRRRQRYISKAHFCATPTSYFGNLGVDVAPIHLAIAVLQ